MRGASGEHEDKRKSVGEPESDAWHSLAGFGSDDVSAEPGEVDAVVYGT